MNKKRFQNHHMLLIFAVIIAIIGLALSSSLETRAKSKDYDQLVKGALHMKEGMELIKDYKLNNNIPLSTEDFHQTGLLGEEFNGITTTIGYSDAKRTSANWDMAAYVIGEFNKAGLQGGDKIAVNASGSFPALNLAVLSAAHELDLEVVMVVSIGASMYGANNLKLTSADMVLLLEEAGLIKRGSLQGITLGGDYDTGYNMDPVLVAEIEARLKEKGYLITRQRDYSENIWWRRSIFEVGGLPKAFISIGGNLTSLGDAEITQVGLLDLGGKNLTIDESSGLTEIYYSMGIPTIRLIEMKKIVANAGLAFDPSSLPLPGESSLYYQTSYPVYILVASLLGVIVLILLFRKKEKANV